MIKPVNNHILISPLKRESFIPSEKNNYEEIGVVLDGGETPALKGQKVYFDSFLAAKFPAEKEGEFLWFVNWKDIRAVEDE